MNLLGKAQETITKAMKPQIKKIEEKVDKMPDGPLKENLKQDLEAKKAKEVKK